jgi:hypothetical protein
MSGSARHRKGPLYLTFLTPAGNSSRMLSPDNDGGRQRNWGHHKAEVDPPFIRLDGLGNREQVDDDPQSHRETQCQPNEVAGGLVYGPKGLALGRADAHRYCHERTHEQRSENDG